MANIFHAVTGWISQLLVDRSRFNSMNEKLMLSLYNSRQVRSLFESIIEALEMDYPHRTDLLAVFNMAFQMVLDETGGRPADKLLSQWYDALHSWNESRLFSRQEIAALETLAERWADADRLSKEFPCLERSPHDGSLDGFYSRFQMTEEKMEGIARGLKRWIQKRRSGRV